VIQQRVLTLPGVATSAATARRFAVAAGAELGAGPQLLSHIALVVSELATNAIEASPGEPYQLTIDNVDGLLTVEVRNHTTRADIPDRSCWKPRDPLALRGRGLGIVADLAHNVQIDTEDGHVRVKATIRLDG
jgi:anti-sigma regulatory factor (Ser/Thr protein kinase)